MIVALVATAAAESWCAAPLEAHEWGVTLLAPRGATVSPPSLPDWMHRSGAVPHGPAVRTLPPDSGIRDLPVLSFHGVAWNGREIPVGVSVGFTTGSASVWYPQVDVRTPAEAANGSAAAAARRALVAGRQAPERRRGGVDPGRDPTRQLHWDALVLTPEPVTAPLDASGWVTGARDVSGALWVNRPGETERFVFYEAETRESPALVLEPGPTGPSHRVLRNTSDWDVHDVLIVRDGRMWTAPRIPAGKTAGFLLEDPFDAHAARAWLTERWTDPSGPPVASWDPCVMMRDPAVPAEVSQDHRIHADELAVLWSAWADTLLDGRDRVVYREDTAALDAVMPLSIYTDMYHDPSLVRLGVVSVEGP